MKNQTHGSVFDTVTRDTFANIEIELPSIDEQRRVGDILSTLDNKIERNKAINHHLAVRSATDSSPDIRRGRRLSRIAAS